MNKAERQEHARLVAGGMKPKEAYEQVKNDPSLLGQRARKVRKDGTPALRMGEKGKLKRADKRARNEIKFKGMMRFLKVRAAKNASQNKKKKNA
jgi:hypothetical protein